MALLDFLNTSLVINIGTIILLLVLVGGLYAYFSNKLSAQDHKISSMVSCVSTMAEEVQLFRKQMNERSVNENNVNTVHLPSHMLTGGSHNNLIEVSDNDSDDSDDSDDETTVDEDSDVCTDIESDDHASESDIETHDMLDESLEDFKLDEKYEMHDLTLEEDIVECNNIKTIHIDDDEQSIADLEESVDLTKLPIPHIKEEIDVQVIPQEDLVKTDELKTISIVDNDNDNDSDDDNIDGQEYKKMSLTKLRELAVKKKLTNDASKMKKNDILKLMGFE